MTEEPNIAAKPVSCFRTSMALQSQIRIKSFRENLSPSAGEICDYLDGWIALESLCDIYASDASQALDVRANGGLNMEYEGFSCQARHQEYSSVEVDVEVDVPPLVVPFMPVVGGYGWRGDGHRTEMGVGISTAVGIVTSSAMRPGWDSWPKVQKSQQALFNVKASASSLNFRDTHGATCESKKAKVVGSATKGTRPRKRKVKADTPSVRMEMGYDDTHRWRKYGEKKVKHGGIVRSYKRRSQSDMGKPGPITKIEDWRRDDPKAIWVTYGPDMIAEDETKASQVDVVG